jgi:hypothetical protein
MPELYSHERMKSTLAKLEIRKAIWIPLEVELNDALAALKEEREHSLKLYVALLKLRGAVDGIATYPYLEECKELAMEALCSKVA